MPDDVISFSPIDCDNQLNPITPIFLSYSSLNPSTEPSLNTVTQNMLEYVQWLDNQACPPKSYRQHPIDSELQLNDFKAIFEKVFKQVFAPELRKLGGQSLTLGAYLRIKRAHYLLNIRFNKKSNTEFNTSPITPTEILTKTSNPASFNSEQCEFSYINTPLGMMLAVFFENKLCVLEFLERQMLETELNQVQKQKKCHFIFKECQHSPIAVKLQSQLDEYFSGMRTQFDIPLDTVGTEFQQAVWQTLQDIDYGTTVSYQQEAENMGKPTAMRAVANANGKNKLSIIIPCHRVIRKNGDLGGYGGGIWRKRFLLALEERKVI